MEEILYELKDHSAGLNCGIWDYSASFINKFGKSFHIFLVFSLIHNIFKIIATMCECESHSGEVYSRQHYMIKFVCYLRQVDGFLQVLLFPPPIKLTAMI